MENITLDPAFEKEFLAYLLGEESAIKDEPTPKIEENPRGRYYVESTPEQKKRWARISQPIYL